MSSLWCNRQQGGQVDVIDRDVVEELVIDGNDHIMTLGPKFLEKHIRRLDGSMSSRYVPKSDIKQSHASGRRPTSTPNPGFSCKTRNMDPDALIGHTLKLQKWLNQKSVHALQEKTDTEAKETKKLYDPLLETESTFVKDLEDQVKHKEMLDLRKKEMLHFKWKERVFEPIRNQVDKEIHSPMYDELAQRKRALHKEYIEHNNKKAHTKHLRDPLHSQERDRCEDDRILFRCLTGDNLPDRYVQQLRLPPLPLVPLGRHGTESTTWVEMPLGNIESPVRMASRRRMNPNNNKSQVTFNWNSPRESDVGRVSRRYVGNPEIYDMQSLKATVGTSDGPSVSNLTIACES